ncbi:MAG TPA: hypothetical protein VM008_02325 [Phycisphaerae bacterium]|nr:hypothetical protein [Phycisphaerae bacterium]
MLTLLASSLAQIKTLDSTTPRIPDPPSTATTWMIVSVLVVAILIIAFKTARRNHQVIEK